MSRHSRFAHLLTSRSLQGRVLPAVALFAASAALFTAAPSPTATTPDATVAPAIEAAPAPLPVASLWSERAAKQLREEIRASADEGLRPSDYALSELDRAIESGKGAALDQIANASALSLARDYSQGRVTDRRRFGWLMERSAYETADLPQRMADAVARNDVKDWLRSLLPTDDRYAALRDAYVHTSPADVLSRDRLRVNMERWRWMPRALGDRYIYVNVPSYKLALMEGKTRLADYTVVVGSPKTPTPQLAAYAESVVVNPWWTVPKSIIKSSNLTAGSRGYVMKAGALRQPPGPRNSLGKIKIDMPNAEAIYLHDTPSKALFARDERAFSHGCIRVKDVDQLAADLLGYDQAATGRLDSALDGTNTTTIAMPKSWPVYLVYFTADVGEDGQMATYSDPYGRDAPLLAALDGTIRREATMTVASR
ncbi:L,D-transpeptidase family protein [Sphingomonas naphthae]|uniref:L,D-transpeptidase family protein n=1 Tax=Sphingomonas naphthae TaxID=1813468 RepID=A0ABY7TL87_9SPHN|nr:L,D-transpeptidase family protein [Sphingomonas naphthae]WCT73733.1 L,D-transpeptidase family protein [Sphingomonas naphthae]